MKRINLIALIVVTTVIFLTSCLNRTVYQSGFSNPTQPQTTILVVISDQFGAEVATEVEALTEPAGVRYKTTCKGKEMRRLIYAPCAITGFNSEKEALKFCKRN